MEQRAAYTFQRRNTVLYSNILVDYEEVLIIVARPAWLIFGYRAVRESSGSLVQRFNQLGAALRRTVAYNADVRCEASSSSS